MDFQKYKQYVNQLKTGKQLPDAIYLHQNALSAMPAALLSLTDKITRELKIPADDWNIIKLNKRDFKITFLNYPNFETSGYPTLQHSFTVDLNKLTVRKASYEQSDNPPILHRKETFISSDHPLWSLFREITAEGEKIGLYKNTRTIGFKKNWEKLIADKGYFLDDEGRLHPCKDQQICHDPSIDGPVTVKRHKTAINRNQLSQPMQILARHNYLNGEYSILDYGCGKGDDIRELEAHGINVSGWDPVYFPDNTITQNDIVNLGFVLNVIEDIDERTATLKRAWQHTDKLLIVAVMVAGETITRQFTPYKDGVITSRNTFQRYYSQPEFRSYLESSLDESAIAVGQGIFIIFKEKTEEQQFLLERQFVKRDWLQKTQRQIQQKQPTVRKDLIDKHLALFTDFWETSLELGRIPANSEFEFSTQIRQIAGSHNKAHEALKNHFGNDLFAEAEQRRRDDLLVYFALNLFEKRKPQTQMPEGLKRDIKYFYNSYAEAVKQATKVLFTLGKPQIIYAACVKAYQQLQCGEFNENHSYIFHKKYLGDLPPELRIYIGCATQLYGDLDNIHLIKAHIRSGKVSLMRYDNWNKSEPLLIERIKIKLREQTIDFFEYGEIFESPPLENKALFEPGCKSPAVTYAQ